MGLLVELYLKKKKTENSSLVYNKIFGLLSFG
jgi:hypothetical protein